MQRDVGVLVGAEDAGAGIVDPDVNTAEAFICFCSEAHHGFRVGHVGCHRERPAAERFAFRCETFEDLAAPRGQITVAPRSAKAIAAARPIPLEAPVMTTRVPTIFFDDAKRPEPLAGRIQ